MNLSSSWSDTFRKFDDACNEAIETGDWPDIQQYVDHSNCKGGRPFLFWLLFTKMHALAKCSRTMIDEHWPDLHSWFQHPELAADLSRQIELLSIDRDVRWDAAADGTTLEREYFDRFPRLFQHDLQLAKHLGAEEVGRCPNTGVLLAACSTTCRKCGEIHKRFGAFLVGEYLGDGGQADVHRAYSFDLDEVVALKRLRRTCEPHAVRRDRSQQLLQEGTKARILRHTHVVPALDCGCVEDTPFIAYSLISGQNLATYLPDHPTMTPRDAASRA